MDWIKVDEKHPDKLGNYPVVLQFKNKKSGFKAFQHLAIGHWTWMMDNSNKIGLMWGYSYSHSIHDREFDIKVSHWLDVKLPNFPRFSYDSINTPSAKEDALFADESSVTNAGTKRSPSENTIAPRS